MVEHAVHTPPLGPVYPRLQVQLEFSSLSNGELEKACLCVQCMRTQVRCVCTACVSCTDTTECALMFVCATNTYIVYALPRMPKHRSSYFILLPLVGSVQFTCNMHAWHESTRTCSPHHNTYAFTTAQTNTLQTGTTVIFTKVKTNAKWYIPDKGGTFQHRALAPKGNNWRSKQTGLQSAPS